jgi:hypothetical protein
VRQSFKDLHTLNADVDKDALRVDLGFLEPTQSFVDNFVALCKAARVASYQP